VEKELKSKVKAWLFFLLSRVESDEVETAKLLARGETITLEIQFKGGKTK